MKFIDDWFTEPEVPHPPHAINADYGLRLRAWGWLREDGTLPWERSPNPYNMLSQYYIPAIREQLNRPLFFKYGSAPWWYDPSSKEGLDDV